MAMPRQVKVLKNVFDTNSIDTFLFFLGDHILYNFSTPQSVSTTCGLKLIFS